MYCCNIAWTLSSASDVNRHQADLDPFFLEGETVLEIWDCSTLQKSGISTAGFSSLRRCLKVCMLLIGNRHSWQGTAGKLQNRRGKSVWWFLGRNRHKFPWCKPELLLHSQSSQCVILRRMVFVQKPIYHSLAIGQTRSLISVCQKLLCTLQTLQVKCMAMVVMLTGNQEGASAKRGQSASTDAVYRDGFCKSQ